MSKKDVGRPKRPIADDPLEEAKREKVRLYCKAYREAKKPKYRAIIDEFLNRPCVDCGVQFHLHAMQPDHIGPKKYKIAWFRGGNGTLAQLHNELAQCEVRCANCHCIRHGRAT